MRYLQAVIQITKKWEKVMMSEEDNVSNEEIEAAEDMLDKLEACTFYKEQEEAVKELVLTIKYI